MNNLQATHSHLMGCLCTTYEVNRSERDGAMEWKRQNLQTTCGTLTFDPEMMRDTSSPYGLFVYHLWSESVKKERSPRADTAKPSNDPCDFDLCLFDPEMVRDTWPLHIHGASRVCAAYSPRAGCEQRYPMAYGGRIYLQRMGCVHAEPIHMPHSKIHSE